MKKVNGVKIPERKTTSPQFRAKWSKLIDSYSLEECQKLKDQIMSKDWMYTMTNPYSVEERFNGNKMVMGTWKWTGDASEERCTTETKLTSLIFPLAHYLDFDEVDVLGFDLIGGRFYDKIDGVPSDPWPKHQLPLLVENMKVWNDWKEYHNMDLVSVVNDDLTINNQALEYKDISEFKLKTWSEYYKECKEVYGNSDSDINNLTIHTKHFKDAPKYTPRRRLDETAAARNPILRWKPEKNSKNNSR